MVGITKKMLLLPGCYSLSSLECINSLRLQRDALLTERNDVLKLHRSRVCCEATSYGGVGEGITGYQ